MKSVAVKFSQPSLSKVKTAAPDFNFRKGFLCWVVRITIGLIKKNVEYKKIFKQRKI